MKNVLLVIGCLVLFPCMVLGAPYIVCDPQATITSYEVTGGTWFSSPITAQADGSIKMDIASAPVGNNSLSFKACRNDAVWGVQCSTASPFDFTRPGAPVVPAGLRVVP